MSGWLRLIVFGLTLMVMPMAARGASQFANPLDVRTADPHVLYDDGTYFMYGTGGNGFMVWTSRDLVNWRNRGLALTVTGSRWGKNRYWAPEVIKYNGSYYMFYSAGGAPDNILRICVAQASSPLGPFVDIAAPLWNDGKAYIDAHVFVDSNGTPYMYCAQDISVPADGTSDIVVARMKPDMRSLDSALTICIQPSQSWEYAGSNRWNEAPFVMKNGIYYYMLYSGNVYSSFRYSVGYATATSPLGPWTKYNGNPVLKGVTGSISGPGHCSVIPSPDGTENWMVYHTHQQLSGGGERQLAIDRMRFVGQPTGPARLVVDGPTKTMQTAPSGTADFTPGASDEFAGTLNRNRWHFFNEVGANWTHSGGALTITTALGDTHETNQADQQNILLCYPPSEDFEFDARVTISPGQNYEQASLFVWQDHNNFIRYSNAWIGGRRWEMGVEIDGTFTHEQVNNSLGSECFFKIRKVGNLYSFYTSVDGAAWTRVGSERTVNLIDRKIGLGASSTQSGRALPARFEYFRIQPLSSGVNDWAVY